MRCPGCQQENAETNAFCIFCGAVLSAEPSGEETQTDEGSTETPPEEVSLAGLQRQVSGLQQAVEEIRATLAIYGMRLSPSELRQVRSEVQPPRRREPVPAPAGPPSGAPPQSAEPPPPAEPPAPMPWERIQVNWELILGGNWLARVGVLAVVIGMGFFLKLAFDNDWIGETGRVVLGIVGGLAFLGAGEYWHKRYPAFAQALAGGGVALLYLSIFAAFAIFELIDLYPGIGLLFLISVASAALALRYESVAVAIIGIFGAFAAPFAMGGFAQGTDEVASAGSSIQLMVYVMVVDVGVLALCTFRNWRWFTLLGLLGSLLAFGSWYGGYGDEVSLLTSQGSLTIIFLLFVGATTLFHIIWRRAPQAFDQSLMVINAAAYLGISYGLLWDDFRLWMGGFTLLLSLFYGGLAYAALLRSREHVYLSFMALGIALVLLTVAVPVQLGGPWVSVAWAAEGAVLIWLSFRLRMWQLRVFGVGVFAIFAAWLLFLDTPEALSASLTPFANKYLPVYLASIGATYLAAYLLRRNQESLQEWERRAGLFPAFLVAANLFLTVAVPVQVNGAWIAFAWAVEALALMWLSFRLGLYELRFFGIGVFATLAVRLLAFDTLVDLDDFRLILNYRMLAFASGVVALYLAAYLMRREQDATQDWEKNAVLPALLVGASFLTLWVLSAEVIAAVDSGIVKATGRTADHVKSLSLSLLWAVYASLALVLGIVKRWRVVRLAGLGLLAVPVLKLFLVDSFALERGYRVAAFLGLGGILLVGGFLYQQYSTAIRGFLFEEQQTSPES